MSLSQIRFFSISDRAKDVSQWEYLGEALKKAESEYKRTLLNTIRSAALERSGNWTAAAWLLERRYPEEFGHAERKLDDGAAVDAPQIVLGVAVQVASGDDALPSAATLSLGTGCAGALEAAAEDGADG